ncbi:MAG: DegT/DnrJ/EryC1/StrS aminotransferase family protein [Clostridiales Family XIII bacterium]|nr:DegT/DnrJ/EryC1/StrS aminotransferase family protein [Clostridiales Family XIII bacterium]
MEFRDLKQQYSVLRAEIDQAVSRVLSDADFISGRAVAELEGELAGYVSARHCISCANGTDALSLAMMAWGLGPDDAVFVPDFTFFSTAEVVAHAGATPVFVDVDEDTFNIDPEKLEAAIVETAAAGALAPRAVVAVDLFGLCADYAQIRPIAEKHGLLLLEDAAQGFGGSRGGRMACSFGDISTTSFFPAKPLGCYGDGGAVFTDDDGAAELLRSLRIHGKGGDKYDNVRIGLNSRLDTLQAAILKVKLKAFREAELAKVNEVAGYYSERLGGRVAVPRVPDGYISSWAQYTIRLAGAAQREAVMAHLKAQGIPSMVYYRKPLHRQGAFAALSVPDAGFERTIRLCDTVLSLPMHPYMTEEDVARVSGAVLEGLGGNG